MVISWPPSLSLCSVPLNSNGRIFPPYLKIEYESWSPNSQSSNQLPVSWHFWALDVWITTALSLPLSPSPPPPQASYTTEYVRMTFDFTIGLCVTLSVLAVGVAVYAGFRVNGFLRRSGQLCCHIHVCFFMRYIEKKIFTQNSMLPNVWSNYHQYPIALPLSLPPSLFRHLFSLWLSLVPESPLPYSSCSLSHPPFGSSSSKYTTNNVIVHMMIVCLYSMKLK